LESKDPRQVIDQGAMRLMQWVAVGLCVVLNALDGFDVLAISFASPGIAAEWHVERAALGPLLAMELFGMAAGSILLGHLADRIGRRPTTLLCLVMMAAGMAGAAVAPGVAVLALVRFCTGLGIGGMLASINAMAAEYANGRNRALAVTLMAAGYPAGAIVGGSIASVLLIHGGWRDIFVFGAIATAALLPIAWWLLPESIGFLVRKRPAGALERINAALRRFGHASVAAMPPVDDRPRRSFAALFAPDLIGRTGWLTLAYFAHITTFYFTLKWIPKIVADLGHSPAAAGLVLVWANVGGLSGALLFSVLTRRWSLWRLLGVALAGAAILVTCFGQVPPTLEWLSMTAGAAGFFANAAVVCLYALMAEIFPVELRAGGTGFVIGTGRGGAAIAPVIAGALFAAGFGLAQVSACMALGSVIAVVALLRLRAAARQPVLT
jgi:benzoate transport